MPREIADSASPAAFCASLGEFQSDVFAAWAMFRHIPKYAVVA
jgi:hypothetical protein